MEVFPAASVAVQWTVVVPRVKVAPEGGAHVAEGAGSTASLTAGL